MSRSHAVSRFLPVQSLVVEALFFKFIFISWTILCAVSQTTYFAANYTGSLGRMLVAMKISQVCAKYCRRTSAIYISLAWIVLLMNLAFLMYAIFFSGGYMDFALAPIAIHINVSDLFVPRCAVFVLYIYLSAAWIFPHAASLMLANIFSHQYLQVEHMFEQRLLDCDRRQMPDSEIEIMRRRHEGISISVNKADRFLMFSNAAAFCCQLFGTILLLYALIFHHRAMTDPIIIVVSAFWMFAQSFGLLVTIVGGIMVHHCVSSKAYVLSSRFFFASEDVIRPRVICVPMSQSLLDNHSTYYVPASALADQRRSL